MIGSRDCFTFVLLICVSAEYCIESGVPPKALHVVYGGTFGVRLFRRHGYTTPIFILAAFGIFQIFRTTAVKGGRLATESSRTTGGDANRSSFQVQRLLHVGNSLCLPIAVE